MSPCSLLLSLLFSSFVSLSPPTAASITSFSISNSPWGPKNGTNLISKNGTFTAGFRNTTPKADSYFFGVWVTKSRDQFVVWSIFNDTPFDSSTQLSISSNGELSLANNSSNQTLWTVSGNSNPPQLVLKDTGELQFYNWSSFNYLNDSILPEQTVPQGCITLQKGKYRLLNASALSFGEKDTYWINQGHALTNLTDDGRLMFSYISQLVASDVGKTDRLRRLTLDLDGNLRLYSLKASTGMWQVVWQAVQELCTIRGTCGLNSICMPDGPNNTKCVCPPGYAIQNTDKTSCTIKLNYTIPSSKFLQLDFVSFVNSEPTNVKELTPRNFADCSLQCLRNSSCVAFSYKFTGSRDCTNIFGKLYYGYWSPGTETATYLRVSESETDTSNFTGMTQMIETVCPVRVSLPEPPKVKTTARNIAIITILFSLELFAGVLSFWAFLKKYSKYRDMARAFGLEYLPAGGPRRFTYAELKSATSDFSNKVGNGGYGVVYKGQLPDGRAIAVKRLKNVGGGEAEFWAEVTIIARMHHLNLVRMWGFCADKEQRMLVYEYVSNGSLDKFLFPAHTNLNENVNKKDDRSLLQPPRDRPLLDWNTRYRIALGVARAIAYLHEECLEWVLHCDIKPENILLEDDFCPKVSDFGLSKLTNKKDNVRMSKIRGTRGYMAPEWVIKREPITAKADVYSFGMVLLEIVSGRRNYGFQHESMESEDWYFPKWAFEKAYEEGKMEDIVDPRIIDGANDEAVERMVKTAIWCVQDRTELRPSMGKVAKMLEGTIEITEPAKPIFCMPDEGFISSPPPFSSSALSTFFFSQ